MTPKERAKQFFDSPAMYFPEMPETVRMSLQSMLAHEFSQVIAEERANARTAAAAVMRSLVLPRGHKQLPTADEFVAALDKILAAP